MIVHLRRLAVPLIAVAFVAPLAACASDSLRERDARDVRLGQVLATSYTAAIRGTQVHLMIPSGRVDLTLTKPVDEVPAKDAQAAAPLRPTGGATAVGVAWSLNRGGYPDVTTRQLAPPQAIFGVPRPVRLWLVTDGTRHEIPNVATLEVPRGRPRNAAWVIVPSGVRQWRFELDYGGVTQRVDARTGTVSPGAAAPLYRPLPLDYSGSCEFPENSENFTSCSITFAVGFPYVDGAGWAPNGKVFAMLRVSAGSMSDDAGKNIRVGGAASVAVVTSFSQQFRAYLVSPARTYAITGTAPAENDDGKSVLLPVTGSLTTDGTTP